MTTAHPPGAQVNPWWADDRPERLASMLRRLFLALLALVWMSVAVSLAVIDHRREIDLDDHQLMFASVVAVLDQETAAPIVAASGGEALIVEPGRTVDVLTGPESPEGRRHDLWRTRVRNTALSEAVGRQYGSVDPNGRSWRHTAVPTSGGRTLIFSTPDRGGIGLGDRVTWVVVSFGLALSLALAGAWWGLLRRIATPVGLLLEGAEDLLLRGSLRADTRRAVLGLAPRPKELHRLGSLLDSIGTDFQDSARRNEALLAASNALGALLDPDVVLSRSLEHLQRLLGLDRSAILRYDPRTNRFRLVAWLGHDESWVRDIGASDHDPTLPSVRAAREQIPVQVSDIELDLVSPALAERGRRHGYRAILAVPLPTDLEHPTVLVVHSDRPRTFSYDEIELCKSFASVSGAALRNAELYARTDQRLEKQTSTLEAIIDSVDQGLVVESTDGEIVFSNATMSSLVAAMAGANDEAAVRSVVDSLEPDRNDWADIDLVLHGGERRTYRVRTFLVRDPRGVELGRGYTWTDVSRGRELDRMKEGLLAAVSHEFRTPLALIKGYATTLLADDVEWDVDDSQRFLSMISGEADRLSDLVQRLLDMRRIDAGMVTLDLLPTELDAIVGAAVDGVPDGVGRVVVEPLPAVTVDCDAARLTTALRNLIDNACRYTPPDRPVTVEAVIAVDGQRPDRIEITVSDRGPGVPFHLRNHIFDTFVRGETGLAVSHPGLGLGLAIARGFVEAHGGTLTVGDRSDGPGAVFRMSVPVESAGVEVGSGRLEA